jgi:hypothetical protein
MSYLDKYIDIASPVTLTDIETKSLLSKAVKNAAYGNGAEVVAYEVDDIVCFRIGSVGYDDGYLITKNGEISFVKTDFIQNLEEIGIFATDAEDLECEHLPKIRTRAASCEELLGENEFVAVYGGGEYEYPPCLTIWIK